LSDVRGRPIVLRIRWIPNPKINSNSNPNPNPKPLPYTEH